MTLPPNRPAITVERLRLLAAIADAGSITETAHVLGVTPSAVSQQLAALERDVDVALVDRQRRGVTLTAAGLALVEHAARVDAALEAAATDLARLRGAVGGPVSVAAVTSAAMTFVSDAVVELATAHPDLQVTVSDEEPLRSLERLARGEVDLAVVDRYDVPPVGLDGLASIDLLDEPVVIVAPVGWRAPARGGRARGTVLLDDLRAERWVLAPPTASCGDAVRRACQRAGWEPNVVRETDDILAHHRHVEAGHGIAALPRLATEGVGANVRRVRLVEPSLTRRLVAVTRPSTVQRPAIAALQDALITAAARR